MSSERGTIDEQKMEKKVEENVIQKQKQMGESFDENNCKKGNNTPKNKNKSDKDNSSLVQIKRSVECNEREDCIILSSSASDLDSTDTNVCVDLTEDDTQEQRSVKKGSISNDQEGPLVKGGVTVLTKRDESGESLGKKSDSKETTVANEQKGDTDMRKNIKESNVIQKDKSIKNPKKASDSTGKKKKGRPISNKKVRGVQDQEIPGKKQTSLTDLFQVRRSERKLKSLFENEEQRALEKQILSGIEDGLEIQILEDKGRGIFASKNFVKGSVVCEYAGELINLQEAKDREAEYEKLPDVGSYMYFFNYRDHKYCVDATKETDKLGRLVNHSKTSSNVHTKVFPVNDIPHLILVASRDIDIGEELLYDYGDRSKKSTEYHPWLKT